VLDASAAATHGDVLEGMRRALAALGRTRLVGAGPTMASFDGSAGVVVVAGDLCPRAGGVARGRGRGAGAVTFESLRGRGARGVLPVLGGATSSRATSTRGPSSGTRGSRARSRGQSGHV